MRRILFMLLFLSECGGHYSVIPNQERAVATVWWAVYNQTLSAAPQIQWNVPNCDNDTGFWGEASGYSGTICLGGRYNDPPEDYIELAPNPRGLFSLGSLAHELNHARLMYDAGDADPDHLGASWRPCDASYPVRECGLMDDANAALAGAGL